MKKSNCQEVLHLFFIKKIWLVKHLIIFILCLIISIAKAQNSKSFFRTESTGFDYFDKNIAPEILFAKFQNELGLTPFDYFKLTRREGDNIGFTHYRYQQYYKNIKVEGAEYILHYKTGELTKGNGYLALNITLGVIPTVSESEALKKALLTVPAKLYLWENKEEEQLIKIKKKDSTATNAPFVELIIYSPNSQGKRVNSNYKLCYRTVINTIQPSKDAIEIYIDAHTGDIIRKKSLIQSCNSTSICTPYNGSQSIRTASLKGLHNDCIAQGLSTRLINSNGEILEIASSTGNWCANKLETFAATLHWISEKTFDYYLKKHGMGNFGVDNNGILMTAYLSDNASNSKASWNPVDLALTSYKGDAMLIDASNYFVAIDIVGHEWTHGVTQFSSNLRI